jgi:hypothetical protein
MKNLLKKLQMLWRTLFTSAYFNIFEALLMEEMRKHKTYHDNNNFWFDRVNEELVNGLKETIIGWKKEM